MDKKIDLVRKLRILKKALSARLLKRYAPVAVSWAITKRCNLNCLYCEISKAEKKELDTKSSLKIIDRLAALGTERIAFTGGEPLLRDDLGTILNYARSKGILAAINTNGQLVKTCLGQITNASSVVVSLDGPEHIHDRLRQNESYRGVIEAVKACKAKNISVMFATTLSKYNLDFIDYILDLARSLNIRVVFQPATLYTLGTNRQNPVALDPEKYRVEIERLIKRKTMGDKNIYNSVIGLWHLYRWPETTEIPCWAAKLHCRIDCDGGIYSCARTVSVFSEPAMAYTELDNYNNLQKKGIANCRQCWCGLMVEFNLALSLNLNALLNMVRMEF